MYRRLILATTLLATTGLTAPAFAQFDSSYNSQDVSGSHSSSLSGSLDQVTNYGGASYSPSSTNANNASASGGASYGNSTSTSIGGYSNNNQSSANGGAGGAGGSTDFHNNDFSSTATGGAGGSATGGTASSGSASGAYSGGSTATTGASRSVSAGGASTSGASGGRSAAAGGSTGAVTNDNRSNSKNKSTTSPFTVFAPTPVQPRNTAGVQFIDPHGAMPQEVEAHDFSVLGGYAFSNSYVGPTKQSQDSYRISRISSVCAIEPGKGRSASVAALALIDPDMGKILAREGCN